jgi:hypothetical protein
MAMNTSPIRLADLFRGVSPRAATQGGLCEISNCTHLAFVSIRVEKQRRQLCLSHYEGLSQTFGRHRADRRSA